MCLIAYMPAGRRLSEEDCAIALRSNPDGYGIMYPACPGDSQGNLVVVRNHKSNLQAFLRDYRLIPADVPVAIHWRLATVGEVKPGNTHPFPVLSLAEGDDRDLWFMHNGGIDIETIGNRSDSWSFGETILRPLLAERPDILQEKVIQDLLAYRVATDVGYPNRLLMMEGSGRVTIIGEETGHEYQGCWLSNRNSVACPKVKNFSAKAWDWTKYRDSSETWDKYFPVNTSAGIVDRKEEEEEEEQFPLLITTSLLLQASDTEIFDLIINEPDAVCDWIVDHVHKGRS